MRELNCPMLATSTRKSEEGYLILEGARIQTPSREILNEFLNRTKDWIQFINIGEIDEIQFKKGFPLINYMGITEITELLRKAAHHNEQIAQVNRPE